MDMVIIAWVLNSVVLVVGGVTLFFFVIDYLREKITGVLT